VSSDNVERVRAILPPDGTDLVAMPFEGGEVVRQDAAVRFVARDAEMGGAGPDDFAARWTDWLEPWESYRMYTDDVVDRGDRVVCLVRLCGITKRDGVAMEHEGAAIFRFDGNAVDEVTFTLDRDEALRV
jgi:hypothetical protein